MELSRRLTRTGFAQGDSLILRTGRPCSTVWEFYPRALASQSERVKVVGVRVSFDFLPLRDS